MDILNVPFQILSKLADGLRERDPTLYFDMLKMPFCIRHGREISVLLSLLGGTISIP